MVPWMLKSKNSEFSDALVLIDLVKECLIWKENIPQPCSDNINPLMQHN